MPIHIVSSGDTPRSIARSYGVSVSRLLYDNQLTDQDSLIPGQALLVLIPAVTHQVRNGESLYSIAADYGTTVKALLRNNPYLISTGYQPENIPADTVLVIHYEGEPLQEAVFGGYAYPFIRPDILRESLLYLSELFVFSYGFTMEGELVSIEDERLLQATQEAGVSPILTLTPLDASGAFNNHLVHALVTDMAVQDRVIEEVTATMLQKGYQGIDIDFEYIQAEDREGYAAFVARITEHMNNLGLRTSVALAPKERADWPGLLYEGVDYEALGAAANQVLLMTYEWGYT